MTPAIDLNNPAVVAAIRDMQTRLKLALSATRTVEDAVVPIYAPSLKRSAPEQVGSGVLVEVGGAHLLFSASHVLDQFGEYAILVGLRNGKPLEPLYGERASSARGPSGTHSDDPIDASVLLISGPVPPEVRAIAISHSSWDFSIPEEDACAYAAVGFRSKNTKTAEDASTARREVFPSVCYGPNERKLLGIDGRLQLGLAYENRVLRGGLWETSPTPRGFSGGAIIRFEGVSMNPADPQPTHARQQLVAITTEQRREKGTTPGVLIGTRISVHLGLVVKYWPKLTKDLVEADRH
jgi:hypothetical protein